MVNIFRRKPVLIQLPVVKGNVIVVDQHQDVVKSAIRLILLLALQVDRTERPAISLQRIERINFNITGAKWDVGHGAVSVSLYPERPKTRIQVHAAANSPSELSAFKLMQNRLKELVASVSSESGEWKVSWDSEDTPSG